MKTPSKANTGSPRELGGVAVLGFEDLAAKGVHQGRVQLWRMIRAGKFPRPFMMGRYRLWVEEDVDRFIAERIASRNAGKAAA